MTNYGDHVMSANFRGQSDIYLNTVSSNLLKTIDQHNYCNTFDILSVRIEMYR